MAEPQLAEVYVAIAMVADGFRLPDRPDVGTDEVSALAVELLRRTPAGATILGELEASPADPARQAAARQALADALSTDPQAIEALDEAVRSYMVNPPDNPSVRSTEAATEAKFRRRLLESMEWVDKSGTARPATSIYTRYFANLCPNPQRDINKIEAVYVDSEDPAASVILCNDGSSLIVVQSKVVEWLFFQAQLAWLAGAGEERTGCSSNTSGRRKLQAIFAALVRARLIDWRFAHFPGSLAILIEDENRYNEMAMSEDLAGDSEIFILAHEIAHCALGHASEERSLFGWKQPDNVIIMTDHSEHEADRLASMVLSQFTQSRKDARGKSADYEYYSAWMGAAAAVAAISFWENGLFLRLSRSHPPAADRFSRLRAVFAERWSLTRRLRLSGFDTLIAASGLGAILNGAVPQEPLPDVVWWAAASMPCLMDDERERLTLARNLDRIVCGRVELNNLETVAGLSPSGLPLPIGADRTELESYFSRIGVAPERHKHMLDRTQPLMYSTAVDYISSAPAFSSVESGALRRTIAYNIITKNLDSFIGDYHGHESG